MEAAADERFMWTSKLVDAALALRFTNGEMRKRIESAKGNENKRKAWTVLTERLHKEHGVCIPENKIRRAISKWQSQHRAWVNATAGKSADEVALSERPPSYMPVLDQYFKSDAASLVTPSISPGNKAAVLPATPPTRPPKLAAPTLVPKDNSDSGSSTKGDSHSSSPFGSCSSKMSLQAASSNFPVAKFRKISPNKRSPVPESPPSPITLSSELSRLPSLRSIESPVQPFRELIFTTRASVSSNEVMQTLISTNQEQLNLQKLQFNEMLTLQRQHYEAQFALQRKHVEAVRQLMQFISSDVRV